MTRNQALSLMGFYYVNPENEDLEGAIVRLLRIDYSEFSEVREENQESHEQFSRLENVIFRGEAS